MSGSFLSIRPLLAAAVATAMYCALPASAQDCPQEATELPVQALYGRWEARFDGGPSAGVQLARHPEYDGGVRGTIVRDGVTAQLSGDVDDAGQLTLDESQDGQRISAVWSGDLQKESCGKEFQGTWRNSNDDSVQGFVLRKVAP